MSDNINDYGLLINKNAKMYRGWFKEMCRLHGINCIYKAPRPSKEFDIHGDLDSKYYESEVVPCIFDEYPTQKSLKKMGWVTELQEGSSIIHVPYDLPHLEVGALFIVPSGIDQAVGRVFRVISMQNIMIYPASISCEIAPEYTNTAQTNEIVDFTNSTNNVLVDNEGDD